jgi:aspartate ammonia-lyase
MVTRTEKDLLGEKEIDNSSYWGIHTERAKENFHVSGYRVDGILIHALAIVKKASCMANMDLGYLEQKKAQAIILACDEIINGALADSFPLDALQGGAGTSLNMNMNEVIANRAIEILNGKKGDYGIINPIEDVNLHQSTNDVFPTAVKIASILQIKKLSIQLEKLQEAFQRKEKEFAEIIKIGRTEFQDAVPITLGLEFSAFAEAASRDRWRTFKCEERLRTVNIGGTAVGTGLAAPKSYIFIVIEKLRELTGLGLTRGTNTVDTTANTDMFVEVSAILKASASNLVKIANDLRILNFLGEIKLDNVQPGSSIMPGKVNPVIAEVVIQSGLKVMANDFLVSETSSRSTLQINEFLPLLSFAILESLRILINISESFAEHINNTKADPEKCKRDDLKDFLQEKFGKKLVNKVLSPYKITSLGYSEDETVCRDYKDYNGGKESSRDEKDT